MTPEEAARQLAQKFLAPTHDPPLVHVEDGKVNLLALLGTFLSSDEVAQLVPDTLWGARITGTDPVYKLKREFLERAGGRFAVYVRFFPGQFYHFGGSDQNGEKRGYYVEVVPTKGTAGMLRRTSAAVIERAFRIRETHAAPAVPVVPVDVDKLVDDLFS